MNEIKVAPFSEAQIWIVIYDSDPRSLTSSHLSQLIRAISGKNNNLIKINPFVEIGKSRFTCGMARASVEVVLKIDKSYTLRINLNYKEKAGSILSSRSCHEVNASK